MQHVTPDEIKKGLTLCSKTEYEGYKKCSTCPFVEEYPTCCKDGLAYHAISLIEISCAEIKRKDELIKHLSQEILAIQNKSIKDITNKIFVILEEVRSKAGTSEEVVQGIINRILNILPEAIK